MATLLDPQHEGRAYEVTGREAISLAEAAQILSQVSGREVVYVVETPEEARASRAPSGAPDWEIGEPMTLAEFLEAHPESWAHLTGPTPA